MKTRKNLYTFEEGGEVCNDSHPLFTSTAGGSFPEKNFWILKKVSPQIEF